jgi:aspartate/methionine/tyrosine aminotransferase
MTYHAFELERWQSDWEQKVEINIADSGVEPVALGELLPDGLDAVLGHHLHYPEVNGTLLLRERIAALYPDCRPDQVLVTVGAAEANSLIAHTLLAAGDEAVVMEPGYQQIRGLALNLGVTVRSFPLRGDDGWRPDVEALHHAVGPRTRLISVNSPNNPTGVILSARELDAIAEVADRAGAWLHADEVYRGSELDGPEAPTAWGRSERVLAVGSLSKAYGLSGLRIGWIVAPEPLIAELWRRHEYATIAAASLSMLLAERALAEPMRTRLLDRQKQLALRGRATLGAWVDANEDLVALAPPASTALGFPRLLRHPDSVAAATAIRERASVLVAPGSYLGADGHLRLSHALDPARTGEALDRIAGVLRDL